MEISYEDKRVVVDNLKDFEPKHIFECGQCFRWNLEEDGSYTGVAYNRILNVGKEGNRVIFNGTDREEFNNIWLDYFDLNNDYGKIKKSLLREDEIIGPAIDFGHGIRLLKQEAWETLVSFIISARNAIPRIKKSVELLSENFGQAIGQYRGRTYYGFPSAETISQLNEDDLRTCGLGYRSKYILNTAQKVIDEKIALEELKKLNNKDCYDFFLQFSGVGPKVASCILIFAMGKVDFYPVDIWVKRVMEHFYFKEDTSNKKIEEFAKEKFGPYAAYAQQYLFYYARELGIGK